MVDRVYQRNATAAPPAVPDAPSEGYPTNGNPAGAIPATIPGAYWYHMITESLRNVIVTAGLDPDHEDLGQVVEALQAMGVGTGQFQNYSSLRTYTTGEVVRGSDGVFYEFYDRDLNGEVQGVDPTESANRPHVWMRWDGVRPGQTVKWRSETLPEGYIVNDGDDYSRSDYRRIFAAFGTTYGAGDGSTTFGVPDDRDEFHRGWDFGASGRALAEHQSDAIRNITGSIVGGVVEEGAVFNGAFQLNGVGAGGAGNATDAGIDFDASRVVPTASENRPRNNAVIYLTKI